MAEGRGFEIVAGTPPAAELVQEVKEEFTEDVLRRVQHNLSNKEVERFGWTLKREKLFNDGLDLSKVGYLTKLLGAPCENVQHLFADLVVWTENISNSQRSRFAAGEGLVFIYKAVEGTLNADNGFPLIVEGSHAMEAEQITTTTASPIELRTGEVLILDGNVEIEYPREGGGWGLLKVFRKAVR
ncbi:hypothetical protein F5884DRAFT_673702 [Xylogone sp. PMI_703]|nr:hypothetical protein F5884DRAFT_673702 [Xylogone sp. PMI_703]